MFEVRKTKNTSSACGARSSSAVHTAEEHDDPESSENEEHESDTRASEGEGHVSTPADGVEQDSAAAPQVHTPSPWSRLYAAAAPRPFSTTKYHLQLAGRLYKIEMERVMNEQQKKLSEMVAQYYRHLLEAAPSPVSVASPKTSSADDTSSEVSSSPSLDSTVSRRCILFRNVRLSCNRRLILYVSRQMEQIVLNLRQSVNRQP